MMRLVILLIIGGLQTGSGGRPTSDSARLRYILPEGVDGWVCVDFGVAGAPALNQDEHGVFEIVARRNDIVATSSLPHHTQSRAPSEMVRVIEGQRHRMDIMDISETPRRSEYDFKSPVSRHCVFFGSAKEAHRVGRPPTLPESRNAGKLESEHFEFERGTLCDLKDEPRFCVNARDEEKTNVAKILVGVLRKEPGRTVNTKCGLTFHGIVVRYEGRFSAVTHSDQRGPRYGFGEVRRSQAGKGDVALAWWRGDESGTAAEVAGRFGRDLARLFEQVTSASCRH